MPLGMKVDLGPGDIVFDGDPDIPPPQKKGGGTQQPKFLPMYCGQTAPWIKMPLGTGVVSAQATLCYMGTQLPLKGAQQLPIFGPRLLWPNGWMDQDATAKGYF